MTSNQILAYRKTADKKQEQLGYELALRQKRGWEVAHQAAQLLKKQFAVRKVVLFGSLLNVQRMHSNSDIDLAVWGLAEENYYQAVAQIQDLDRDFSLDLVQIESASPLLQKAILTTGIELDETKILPKNLNLSSLSPSIMTRYAPLIGQIRQDLTELECLPQ